MGKRILQPRPYWRLQSDLHFREKQTGEWRMGRERDVEMCREEF